MQNDMLQTPFPEVRDVCHERQVYPGCGNKACRVGWLPFPYPSRIMGQDDRAKIQQSVGECYLKAASIIVGSRICETPIVKTPAAKRKTVRLRYPSWHTSFQSPIPPCALRLCTAKHCLEHMLYTLKILLLTTFGFLPAP